MRSTALLVKPCYSDASALDYVDGGDDGETLAKRGSGVQIMRALACRPATGPRSSRSRDAPGESDAPTPRFFFYFLGQERRPLSYLSVHSTIRVRRAADFDPSLPEKISERRCIGYPQPLPSWTSPRDAT